MANTFNHNDKVVITDGGNVGISESQPSYKLHVAGTFRASQDSSFGGNVGIGTTSPDRGLTISRSNQYASLNIYKANTTNQIVYLGTGSSGTDDDTILQLFDEATEKVRIFTAGSSWFNGGNVGIGTATPSAALTVAGGTHLAWTAATSRLTIDRSGTVARIQNYDNGSVANVSLQWEGGNVGIGTTSPITKLTVGSYSGARLPYINGTANTFDANGITVTSSNTANAAIGGGIDLTNNVHSVGSFSPLISFSALSQSGTFNNNYAAIYGILAGAGGDANWNTGHIVFATAESFGASEKMRITSAGNVGIGTTSPSSMLTLNGTTPYIRLERSGVPTWELRQNFPSTEYGFQIVNVTAGTIPFFVGNSGNVGIGTTSPGAKLHLSGSGATELRITSTTANTNSLLSFYEDTLASWGIDAGQANGKFFIKDLYNTNTRLTIDASGNVGIGTTAPSEKLELSASGNVYGKIISTTTGGNAGVRFLSTGAREYGIFTDGDLRFYDFSASAERMRITSGGNVGIGTSSPVAQLDITKTFNARAGAQSNPTGGASVAIDYQTSSDIQGRLRSRDWDGAAWKNFTIEANNILLSPAGNVGIGTTAPVTKLELKSPTVNSITNDKETTTSAFVINGSNENMSLQFGLGGATLNYGNWIQSSYDNGTPGSSPLYLNPLGGNVGIGTTNPAYKLEVSGGAISIKGNTAGNSLRFDDSGGTSRNAMYLDTSNYLNVGNANYAGIKLYHTATAPQANGLEGNQIAEGYGTTENGKVLAEPNAWLAVRIGTTDYAIPMYTAG
jgi:hypothetical protein